MVDWSNPEEVKEYQKKYRENHKEKAKEYRKKYYETNKEEIRIQQKKYCENNKEKVKARKKKYYETHKEKAKEYWKKYYETHKEEINARIREYGAKYFVTKHHSYVGVCFCEKCGSTGYKKYKRRYNKKTGNYSPIMTYVYHQHRENGKTVHDGVCYIGMGEL